MIYGNSITRSNNENNLRVRRLAVVQMRGLQSPVTTNQKKAFLDKFLLLNIR
jgi:hypothetical protein